MQFVKITKTIIDHAAGDVHFYYDSSGSVVGTNLHVQLSENETPLDDPNWGPDEQRQALADHLDIDVDQVAVATTPTPATTEEEPS